MSHDDFLTLQRELGFEFSRAALHDPSLEERIPDNAQIVFLLDRQPAFNKRSLALAKRQHEPRQPVVLVHIERLLPTRLVKPRLEVATSL